MLLDLYVFFSEVDRKKDPIVCTAVVVNGDDEIARKSWNGDHQAILMHSAQAFWLAQYGRVSQTNTYVGPEGLDDGDGQLDMF